VTGQHGGAKLPVKDSSRSRRSTIDSPSKTNFRLPSG
jgi:hypothetical protein